MLRRAMMSVVEAIFSWVETFLITLTSNMGNWTGGYTTRTVIPSTALEECTQVRLTLRGATTGSFTVQQAAFGLAALSGDAYDYSSTPQAVTVGGNPSFTIPMNADVVTDPISINVPAGRNCVFAFYATSGGARAVAIPSGWVCLYKAGNDVSTVNASGYTSEPQMYFVRRIECYVQEE